jgi:hypothetical protein
MIGTKKGRCRGLSGLSGLLPLVWISNYGLICLTFCSLTVTAPEPISKIARLTFTVGGPERHFGGAGPSKARREWSSP